MKILIATLTLYMARFAATRDRLDLEMEQYEQSQQESAAENAWLVAAESYPDDPDPEELWARSVDRQWNTSHVPERDELPENVYDPRNQFEKARDELEAQYVDVEFPLMIAIISETVGMRVFLALALAKEAAELQDCARNLLAPACPF